MNNEKRMRTKVEQRTNESNSEQNKQTPTMNDEQQIINNEYD
jgi:hypothetical protein